MIRSFADEGLADVYHGRNTKHARRIPQTLWAGIRRKLAMLNARQPLENLARVPGNWLHELEGDRRGTYAISVNKQFRITFRMEAGDPVAVA